MERRRGRGRGRRRRKVNANANCSKHTYGGSQVPPSHGVPPRDVKEALRTHAVPGEANVASISNQQGDEIAANNFDLGGGPEQRQAHDTHS